MVTKSYIKPTYLLTFVTIVTVVTVVTVATAMTVVMKNFFYFNYFFFCKKKMDKVVELVGGGSVIHGAYPV